MDQFKYRGVPKIELLPEEKFVRIIFHSGNKANDWKNRVYGKKFDEGNAANLWANKVLAMARTKNPDFEKLKWEEQALVLKDIVKHTSDRDLQENWGKRT